MKLLYVLVILLILYVLYLSSKMDQRIYIDAGLGTEHFTNDEAVQNIASLYNAGAMKITNLEVTGNLTVDGQVISDLNVVGNITSTKDISSGGKLASVGDVTAGGALSTVGKITSTGGLLLDNTKSDWATPLQITSANKEGGYIEWVDTAKNRIAFETGAGLYTSNGDFELVKVDASGNKTGFAIYGTYPVIKTNGPGTCAAVDNSLKDAGDMSMFYADNRTWYLKYQNSAAQHLGFAANTNYADATCSQIKWLN